MPISEKEESGARSTGSQSSDYGAVVPIKKRRFPIIRPPSPPPEISHAPPEGTCKQQDTGSVSQVSHPSTLSDAAAFPNNSHGKSKESLGHTKKQNPAMKRGNTKNSNEMYSKVESVGEDGTGSSTVSGGSVNLGTFPLKLSLLTDRQSNMLSTTSGIKPDNDDSHLRANRSNWDLNTTMDTWEGSISDAASVSTDSVYGTVASNADRFDVKPQVVSNGFVRDDISGRRMDSEDRQSKGVDSVSSTPSREALTHESSLTLGLPMSFLESNKIQGSQFSAASINFKPTVVRVLSSSGNSSIGVPRIVKAEPFDETSKQNLAEVRTREFRSLSSNSKPVKPELIEKCGSEIVGNSNRDTPNVVDSALVKAEPGLEGNHLKLSTSEEPANRLNEQRLKGSDRHVGGYLDNRFSENQVTSQDVQKISSDPESSSIRHVVEERKVSCGENTDRVQGNNILGTIEHNKPEPRGELPSSRDDEDCVSEGKIDIPAGVDEDTYDSECESDDGNHHSDVAMGTEHCGREDNEYEDGEVREQSINMGPEGPTCAIQMENVCNGELEHDKLGSPSGQYVVSPPTEDKDSEMQLAVDTDVEHVKGCTDIVPDEKIEMGVTIDTQLQELSAVETLGEINADSPTASQREIDPSATKNPLEDQDFRYIPGATLAPGFYSTAEDTDYVVRDDNDEEYCLTLPKMDACLNSEIVGKDGSDGNRSRIINLSRASNMSSPGKTRSPDRALPVQAGRKRLPDVALEGDKPHLRGRDELYGDAFNRFSRERSRDMFYRNRRSSYARDRGRVHNNMRDDWESGQDFGSGIYKGPVEYRTARYNKYGSEYRNYGSGPDNRLAGSGRGGRKFFNEEAPNFRDMSSRRRSHSGTDGPAAIVGERHSGKFRDFPDDNMDSVFSFNRPPLYEEADGFIRGERNFNSKGLRRIHSKSPIRLRSRSPVQWSSPRRRSPDGFVGHHPEHRRSPAMYRTGLVRSPGRACFQGDSMIRRQSSPPYMSRQMDGLREMNSGRDRGFGRAIMHSTGSHRTRRYDMVNSRERAREGDYFRLPMRAAERFHDLSGGGNNDERRRLGEKRGPVRNFRSSYGAEEKNFIYNTDEPSRSYRVCQEEDVVYQERSNSRERQSERHTTLGAAGGDAQNKTRRVIEEQQEGNFRHSGSELNEVDDVQQSNKRKRF